MAKDEKKQGIVIQYINIALNMLISIFFTPFLLRSLGDAEYGLYRIVQSFAGQLGIMTFGISILVTRNIVKYDTLKQRKEKENFLAMAAIIAIILSILVIVIGFILSLGIDSLFDTSLTASELDKAKVLYWILIFNVSATILNDYSSGLIGGHERFIVKNGVVTFKYVFRVIILIVLIKLNFGSIAIASTDLFLTLITFVFNIVFAILKLGERIKYYYFDKTEFRVAITFSTAILLQAIVNQVNQNLDSVILGAMTSTSTVAMYSVALNIFTMFNSITLVIGTVYTPQATRLVIGNASGKELTDFVIKPGRMQFMIGSLIITGFIIFGKDFIRFWVGKEYKPAYYVSIILMIPAIVPLIQNVTNSILDAMMKRLMRSIILVIMAILNVIVSIICVKRVGYIGAAYGTAFSYIFGNLICMNVYLAKVTTLDLKRMYKELLSRSWIVSICCCIVFYPIFSHESKSLVEFVSKVLIYSIAFIGMLYCFAMNRTEKRLISMPIRDVIRHCKHH